MLSTGWAGCAPAQKAPRACLARWPPSSGRDSKVTAGRTLQTDARAGGLAQSPSPEPLFSRFPLVGRTLWQPPGASLLPPASGPSQLHPRLRTPPPGALPSVMRWCLLSLQAVSHQAWQGCWEARGAWAQVLGSWEDACLPPDDTDFPGIGLQMLRTSLPWELSCLTNGSLFAPDGWLCLIVKLQRKSNSGSQNLEDIP